MKKAKRRPPQRPARVRVVCKWVIVVDEGPLRQNAISQRDRLLAKLQDARRQWERFQNDDKSAFAQWLAGTFGHLLTQLRETQGSIQEKQNLIHEVHDELDWGNSRSYRAAYARVMQQRANPSPEPPPREHEPGAPPFPPEDDGRGSPPPGPSGARAESEEERTFRKFLHLVMGLTPEELDPVDYELFYREFKEASGFREPRARQDKPSRPPEKKSQPNRLKEIYRILVRRLHPDARQETGAEVLSVWHEVQEAYQQGDVERLEVLLALTEIDSAVAADRTSLGQLQNLVRALETDLEALRRSLRQARQDPAWDFGHKTNRDGLARRIQTDLEGELAWQQRCLQELEKQIQRWAAPLAKKPKAAPRPARPNSARPEKSFTSAHQDDFGF